MHNEFDACVMVVTGELDLANAHLFAAAGIEFVTNCPPGTRTVMDLSNVAYLDSAAIGALVRIHTHASEGLVLRDPSPMVRRRLDLSIPEFFRIE